MLEPQQLLLHDAVHLQSIPPTTFTSDILSLPHALLVDLPTDTVLQEAMQSLSQDPTPITYNRMHLPANGLCFSPPPWAYFITNQVASWSLG